MNTQKPSRIFAIAEALLVTLIWASSFVLVKIGLEDLGPLTMAGLRYSLGFVLLLPLVFRNGSSTRLVSRHLWARLFLLGLSAFAIGNGTLFWGLKYISATTGSFLLSLLPVPIMFTGIVWLKEIPARLQVLGVIVTIVGSLLFFTPGISSGEWIGIGIIAVGLVGFTAFSILGRAIARDQETDTITLTSFPLLFGGALLLALAFPLEGLPQFSLPGLSIVLWLAAINTAFAYILYNHSLQVLTALEMNTLLNLSPLGTALLAWIILGDSLSLTQIMGMVIVILGVTLVQWKGSEA